MKKLGKTFRMVTTNVMDGEKKEYIFNESQQLHCFDAMLSLNGEIVGTWDSTYEKVVSLEEVKEAKEEVKKETKESIVKDIMNDILVVDAMEKEMQLNFGKMMYNTASQNYYCSKELLHNSLMNKKKNILKDLRVAIKEFISGK